MLNIIKESNAKLLISIKNDFKHYKNIIILKFYS